MNKKTNKKETSLLSRLLFPLIVILLIVGFVYWGTGSGNKTSENPVAKGVAKFYATVRQATKPGASRINDFTIELPQPSQSADEMLESIKKFVTPASPDWQGEVKKRSFKANETMKTVLERLAEEENIILIWDLKYDYIVKQHFSETSSLKSLVNTIGNVVAGDYGGELVSLYCPRARTVILTTSQSSYMKDACVSTRSSAQLRNDQKMRVKYEQRTDFDN